MLEPEEVDRILALSKEGWGSKRIARELGISRNTVRRYVEAGQWIPYRKGERTSKLAGLEEWLKETFPASGQLAIPCRGQT
ncbi:MAG: helix-turn-helix domain-containing protein [Rhodocyclaceae bacterium]|nr:helix-turn-helix domain-containing protein [Rhodocyclaceae bacterium]